MKVGITGQNGFIGRHLYNFLRLQEGVTLIPYSKTFFTDELRLQDFVKECDTIVHLAALNRHEDSDVLYNTNIQLTYKLISACEITNANPHILISSSTQENRDNPYGQSKKEARLRLEKWAEKNQGTTTGMIIPNVFGPFGKPFYNSFIATFCHQVANDDKPTINEDSIVYLIYINELVQEIYKLIVSPVSGKVVVPSYHMIKVSEVLEKLLIYKESYMDTGEFPDLSSSFDLALFNTFRCYIPLNHFPKLYTKHTDDRGAFVEIARSNSTGQFSYSSTKPGITRGNHFHTRKAERFAVIRGRASIKIRQINSDSITEYIVDGDKPGFVDMPIWHTHNITNIGDDELVTLFWINEPYDPNDSDTYFINV